MVHSELVECKVPIESAACYDSEDPHFVMAVKEATVDVESTREIEQVYPAPVVLESGRSNLMDAIRRVISFTDNLDQLHVEVFRLGELRNFLFAQFNSKNKLRRRNRLI